MATSFLHFEQQSPVELAHQASLTPFLARHPQELSGYTFATLFAWSGTYSYAWSFAGDDESVFLVSYTLEPDPNRHLLQPIGRIRPDVAERLVREATELPYALRMINVSDRFLEENPELVSHFDVTEDRALANYVYRSKDLAELRGTRYAKKRNLLAQAASLYSWTVEPLTPARTDACLEILAQSDERDLPPGSAGAAGGATGEGRLLVAAPGTVLTKEQMLREEVAALELTLRHFGELGQEGVLVCVEGKPSAFAIFEPLTADTAVIHFERALRTKKGLYQIVNKAAAEAIAARGFAFVNREEDIDDPGLRQAKTSYHPSHLVRAWTLTFRR